ncbi:hypothetical protein [Sphingomonas sp.]|uniref:hypothetical protein n=1 Tax=Sphingomonas sp. TaxID=28214 RepID=UPI000DB253D9|nr:hypothetical protein [Sphingomonas sp.]PZU10369.1 MAG: hypothetical protein DI605_07305 [Sphingomonas sp.]
MASLTGGGAYGEGGHEGQWQEGLFDAISAKMAKDDPERAARLAEALRQNLRRRKAQARATDDAPDPLSPPEEPPRD